MYGGVALIPPLPQALQELFTVGMVLTRTSAMVNCTSPDDPEIYCCVTRTMDTSRKSWPTTQDSHLIYRTHTSKNPFDQPCPRRQHSESNRLIPMARKSLYPSRLNQETGKGRDFREKDIRVGYRGRAEVRRGYCN